MKRWISALLAATLCLLACGGMIPFLAAADSERSFAAGDLIEFGTYPQSLVTDETLLAALNALPLQWQNYGYFAGDGSIGSAQPQSYMFYADVTSNGQKYRAVRFTEYRPQLTYRTFSPYPGAYQIYLSRAFQKETVYWFAFEPLQWQLINAGTGLLIADRSLDAQPYQEVIYAANGNYYCDADCTIGANDYAHSSIRTWLTGTFCQTAFTAQEAACITPTTLQIDPYQTVLYEPIADQTAFLFSANATDNMEFYQHQGILAFWAKSNRTPSAYAYIQGVQEQSSIYIYDYPLLRGYLPETDISYVCQVGHAEVNPSEVSAIRPGICIDLEKYAALQASTPDEPETAALNALREKAESVDRTLYTAASLSALDAALADAENAVNAADQAQIDAAADAITAALNGLQYKDADYTALNDARARAAAIDRSLYTAESLAALDAAVNAAQAGLDITQQAQVTAAADAITAALNGLQYKDADYTALNDARARAAAIDRSLYTAESLAALDAAVDAAQSGLDITQQAQVTAAADAITAALNGLQYREADYAAVEAAVRAANALDLSLYTDLTANAVRGALAAVEYGLNLTQQAQVDAYAEAINAAVAQLTHAAVVLRHESCGVIVAGTTLELDQTTVLSVDMVDPASHEGSNYAVGGSIKSLSFYDINLLLRGQSTQPRGTVSVKIKLAEGVNPAKCKVYHVTDDLVNPLVRYANTIDGNYIVFETDHFSEFAVIEVETVADTVAVTQLPAKTVYTLGEAFDPAGLQVTVYYSDGTHAEVSNYDLSTVATDTIGQKKVTVYYTFQGVTISTAFYISVVSPGGTHRLTIRQPSVTALRYGDILMLYVDGSLPKGAKLQWSYDGKGLTLEPAADGRSCAVKSTGTGEGVVTAALTDAQGNPLRNADGTAIAGRLTLTSNGGFLQRMLSFFKDLFRVKRVIDG